MKNTNISRAYSLKLNCLYATIFAPGGNQTCFLLLIPSKIPRALFVRLDLLCGLPSLRDVSFFAFTACFTTAHRNHDNVHTSVTPSNCICE